MSVEFGRKGLAEPFKGITSGGNIAPNLFSARSTGVSTLAHIDVVVRTPVVLQVA